MTDFQIRVTVQENGIAVFQWEGPVSGEALTRAVSIAADDALLARELRRLEVSLPAADRQARRAVMQAGFRQEGVRRAAWTEPDGSHDDVILYSRLAADQVHGPNAFSGVMNATLPKKRTIAHVIFRNESGRVLLCDTKFKTDWELPGGIVEPYEAPRVGATREVAEELGIEIVLGGLVAVDWMPPYLGWDDAMEFIFDGGVLSEDQLASITLQPSEINAIHFCTLEEAGDHLTPLSLRRLTHALAAPPNETRYLEDGRTPA